MKTTFYTLLLLLALASCNKKESDNTSTSDKAVMLAEPSADAVAEEAALAPPPPAAETATQKIIKNANLRFEASDLNNTASKILGAVKKYNALVQSDSQNKDVGSVSRIITARIPSQYFESFINDISKGVAYFDVKDISAQDVTEEYIDVDARIKAKKILEARYFELLKKATKMSDMLEIEKKISEIREEIEAQEGRLRYMKNQVSLSTVTITFYKNVPVETGTTVSYGSKMGNAIASGFNGLSSFFLGLLYIWPFILIFVIAFIIFRKKFKRKQNNNV
jgi:hypothetical protein